MMKIMILASKNQGFATQSHFTCPFISWLIPKLAGCGYLIPKHICTDEKRKPRRAAEPRLNFMDLFAFAPAQFPNAYRYLTMQPCMVVHAPSEDYKI